MHKTLRSGVADKIIFLTTFLYDITFCENDHTLLIISKTCLLNIYFSVINFMKPATPDHNVMEQPHPTHYVTRPNSQEIKVSGVVDYVIFMGLGFFPKGFDQ